MILQHPLTPDEGPVADRYSMPRRGMRVMSRTSVLVGLTVVVMAVLSVFLFVVYKGFERSNSVAAENSIWVVGQLEPAALRFEIALDHFIASPLDADNEQDLHVATGILLSRIGIVDIHLEQGQIGPDDVLEQRWTAVLDHLDAIEDLADRAGGFASLAAAIDFRAAHSDFPGAIRSFNVRAMRVAVDASARDRRELGGMVTRFAVAAFSAIALLLLVLWILVFGWQQLVRTRDKEAATSESLQKVYNYSSEGMIMLDRHGHVELANPAAKSMFGMDDEEFRSPDLLERIIPENAETAEARNYIREMLAPGFPARHLGRKELSYRLQFRSNRGDGAPIDLDVLLTRDRDHDGKPVLIAFIRDITEQLTRETELREARDRAVGAVESRMLFFAAMSHEMRTPVSGAIAAIDAIKTRTTLDAEQERLLMIAEQSVTSALDQINNVLDLAWLESEEIQTEAVRFNLVDVIEATVDQYRPLAETNGNRITLDLPERCEADREGGLRVFMRPLNNLISNAIKHTQNGTIEVRAAILGDQVRIEVEDTGTGIPEAAQGRIFEPFEMDNDSISGGSGLGLPIARRAVLGLNGRIGVNSDPGSGSLFWFTAEIPEASGGEENEPIAPDAPRKDEKERPCRRILLAEDNEASRTLAAEMLGWCGQDVTLARNGLEAVDMARAEQFDVILMDVNMPVMSGIQATRAIRTEGASMQARIIGVTAFGAPDEIRRFRECGMNEVMPKPLTSKNIEHIIGTGAPRGAGAVRDVVSRNSLADATMSLIAQARDFLLALDGDADTETLRDTAHSLKGLAAMLGERGLSATFQDIESMAAEGREIRTEAVRRELNARIEASAVVSAKLQEGKDE